MLALNQPARAGLRPAVSFIALWPSINRSRGDFMARISFRAALALLIAFAAAAVGITSSQAQQLTGGKRLALVIGNSAYRNVTPLINPVNDATDIAAKLKALQFDVLLGTDVTHVKMSALLDEFKAK